MHYAVNLPAFGDFSDPLVLAELAQQAEQAGWDGFFIWDHVVFDPSFHPMLDPWVGLTAVALRTGRLRLGTMITPLARRRPWVLARQTVSIDRASHGRLILGVGLGDPAQWEFGFFGEQTDPRLRAQRLDEGLAILEGLWRGEPFRYQGTVYQLEEMTFQPVPIQQPRIPVWVGGWWPNKPPLRRAARWDGACPGKWGGAITPQEWVEIRTYIQAHRQGETPFDYVHSGATDGERPSKARALVEQYAEAGVTWWVESVDPWRFGASWEEPWQKHYAHRMRERVLQGPPRG